VKINLGWISELRTSNDRQNCQVLMSISCSENRSREVSLFCVQTVGYLLETSFENFSLFEMYHFVQM